MGTLTYDGRRLEFEDRLLVHLQVVIVQRFRRGSGFAMSWVRSVAIGSGRSTIWLTPAIPLAFDFRHARIPAISPDWLHRLTESAASGTGLIVTNEDGSPGQEGAPAPSRASRVRSLV